MKSCNILANSFPPVELLSHLFVSVCRATIKSEVKLEKTLTFVLIATKTSWLFPQLKTDIKNLTNCLEQCN